MPTPRNIASLLLTAAKGGWDSVLDLLFPVPEHERAWETLDAHACEDFGPPREVYTGIFGCFPYRDERISSLIHAVKFRGRGNAAKKAGDILSRALTQPPLADVLLSAHVATAIPLHKTRQRERGFNQSEWILKEALIRSPNDLLMMRVLNRTKHTEPQTSLSRDKRLANIKNAFVVTNPDMIRGKSILLFDDVTTTGATLSEARRVLLEAGAREVMCMAFAH